MLECRHRAAVALRLAGLVALLVAAGCVTTRRQSMDQELGVHVATDARDTVGCALLRVVSADAETRRDALPLLARRALDLGANTILVRDGSSLVGGGEWSVVHDSARGGRDSLPPISRSRRRLTEFTALALDCR